ncbi:hypothetical protein MMC08_004775 [Hypocenomyce scalaris]|nr:hypothetical protein [Hypocenomyce scalaris]
MPVSHIGLTVSHLPTSCSFFLAALSPLGYRYIGQNDNQIGFGIAEADFFISQETPGNEAGAAHVAFSAPSRTAVDAFFTAALKAGGRIHGEPAVRDQATGYYSAAVLDLDGNSIEVVHRTEQDMGTETPLRRHPEGSRVLSWQKDVARSIAGGSQKQPGRQSTMRTVVNNVTTPTIVVSQPSLERKSSGEMSTKALIGTLLGAAAGAAVAYAMTKGEAQSSSRPDAAPMTTTVYQAIEAPPSQSQAASVMARKQQYCPPTAASQPRSMITEQVDYAPPPASSSARGTRTPSHHSTHRGSSTHTRLRAIEAPPAGSTLIDTFVPPTEIPRNPSGASPKRTQTDSVAASAARSPSSHRSGISRAASATQTAILDTHSPPAPHSSHVSARDIALPASVGPSTVISAVPAFKGSERGPAPSLVGSILGLGSVAPSDSVSQAGSKRESRASRSSRRHGSRVGEAEDGGSGVSERTVRAGGGSKRGSVMSLPVRSVSRASVKRSVASFLQGM